MSKAPQLLALAALVALLPATAGAHEDDPKILDRQPPVPGPGIRNGWLARPAAANGPGGPGLARGGPAFTSTGGLTLLAWMPLSDFGGPSSGNDCWGYTSPSGREYALFGHSDGTAFVEITVPTNPLLVHQEPGPESLWRDIKTFEDHAYVVSEGGGGVQVIDLSGIDAGVVTKVNNITTGGGQTTHNVAIDTVSGFLYRTGGGSNGIRVYDLNQSKVDPPLVATWSTRYVHDCQVMTYTSGPYAGRQICFAFAGYNGGWDQTRLDVIDVTNKAGIFVRDSLQYTNNHYSHQGWLSSDGTVVYLGDELDENGVFPTTTYMIDVSDLDNIFEAGSFTNGNSAIGHNMYTVGDLLYQANYKSGLRIWDVSSPLSPVEVDWFDTAPNGDQATFNGLWSVYPYFPSGTLIGSDLERGLFVWNHGDPELVFGYPQGAPTQLDPNGEEFQVQIGEVVPGAYQGGSAMLHYYTTTGWVSKPLLDLGGGLFSARFGLTECGTDVDWYVTAEGTAGIQWADPPGAPQATYSAQSGAGVQVAAALDMESADGWFSGLAGDTATTGLWTRGDPIGTGAQPEDDHTPSGTQCWFTGQGSVGGADGENDVDGGKTTLRTAVYDLSSYSSPVVSYWRWYSNDQGSNPGADVFRVEISDDGGGSYTTVETVGPGGVGTSGGWYRAEFAVTDFVTASSLVVLRFVAEDAGGGSIVEAAVDDFEIADVVCSSGPGTPACFGDGTTIPCPCANTSWSGEGCQNSTGLGAILYATGSNSVGADDLVLHVSQARPDKTGVFLQGNSTSPQPFRDGILCVGNPTERLEFTTLDPFGAVSSTVSIVTEGLVAPGQSRTYQFWYRDGGANSPCAENSNLTNGYEITWQ